MNRANKAVKTREAGSGRGQVLTGAERRIHPRFPLLLDGSMEMLSPIAGVVHGVTSSTISLGGISVFGCIPGSEMPRAGDVVQLRFSNQENPGGEEAVLKARVVWSRQVVQPGSVNCMLGLAFHGSFGLLVGKLVETASSGWISEPEFSPEK